MTNNAVLPTRCCSSTQCDTGDVCDRSKRVCRESRVHIVPKATLAKQCLTKGIPIHFELGPRAGQRKDRRALRACKAQPARNMIRGPIQLLEAPPSSTTVTAPLPIQPEAPSRARTATRTASGVANVVPSPARTASRTASRTATHTASRTATRTAIGVVVNAVNAAPSPARTATRTATPVAAPAQIHLETLMDMEYADLKTLHNELVRQGRIKNPGKMRQDLVQGRVARALGLA